jgi:DNA topoisomerase-1
MKSGLDDNQGNSNSDNTRQEIKVQEAKSAAADAGLRYVNDGIPGIQRVRSGNGFYYLDEHGKRVRDADELLRIRMLAIPPAWEDVWICPWGNGHIQAIGRDARGRKQYRYHNRWREVRDANKYQHILDFAHALPRVRRTVSRHLRLKGLPREKVLAAIVRIMEKTLIRVGNEEYARNNHSFGLTTMRDGHATIRGKKVVFEFRGKSGIEHEIDFEDERLAKIVCKCQDLPQQELFAYLDENRQQRDVTSSDVNDYLREISGSDFTAKDFRTWAGTVLAAEALQEVKAFDSKAAAKRNVKAAIEKVATRLGNTVPVCRKCYVHPDVINSYLDGTLAERLGQQAGKELSRGGLPAEEAAVLGLLRSRLAREAKKR